MRALDGVRVLDLSRILAGPSATQLLGDLGADVVKVERPGAGDDTRGWGPPFLSTSAGPLAGYFLAANRSKRSIAIDFTTAPGAALVKRLAEKADVLVENLKPGDLDRRGLGYEVLGALNGRLVYCSISGFGRTGPRATEPGYDFLAQAAGGLMSLTGEPDGSPQKVGVGIADLYTGMHAAIGILAALHHQRRTGRGQHLDVSLYDCQLAMLANTAVDHLLTGSVPGRLGNAHPHIVPYGVFEAEGGHVVIAVGNDAQFARFAGLLGRPELAADPRFASNRARVEHRAELLAILAPLVRARPPAHWLAALRDAGVPTGPVQDVAEALADPVAAARHMVQRVPMPAAEGGEVALLGHPIQLSATPAQTSRPPPLVGEHRDEILRDWLGVEGEERDALVRSGALG